MKLTTVLALLSCTALVFSASPARRVRRDVPLTAAPPLQESQSNPHPETAPPHLESQPTHIPNTAAPIPEHKSTRIPDIAAPLPEAESQSIDTPDIDASLIKLSKVYKASTNDT